MANRSPNEAPEPWSSVAPPSFAQALGVWAKIGVLSFGGPVGQIAMMHRMLVDERRWLGEKDFLAALNFCMLLPGPEAMQLATYSGWRLHGVAGGLAAGILFVLPGAVLMFALAVLYMVHGAHPLAVALFVGIKAAVLAIVVEALLKVSRRALKTRVDWVIAGLAFIAIFMLALPFPLIIVAAGIAGYLFSRGEMVERPRQAAATLGQDGSPAAPSWRATLATASMWLAIWIVPLLVLWLLLGHGHVLVTLAWFFSKLAVVTFGGAYAVLAYMAQQIVERFGWLTPGEMLDALGLAETTPGPLILVTEFVGALAAGRVGGEISLAMAFAGAVVVLWATFAPCFMWIFTGAPWIERMAGAPRLQAALRGVTAAVVGVILNLSVWFALHVLFGKVDTVQAGPLRLLLPDVSTIASVPLVLSVVAAILLLVLHRGIASTLAVCGILGIAAHLAGIA